MGAPALGSPCPLGRTESSPRGEGEHTARGYKGQCAQFIAQTSPWGVDQPPPMGLSAL